MKRSIFFTLVIALLLALTACSGEDSEQQESLVDAEGIHIEGAWARPGSEGRMSAAYFLITNYDEEDDRLVGVRSEAAQLTEIHESFESDNGMMGMREIPELDIPAKSTVAFEQGGLHVMLIQLTEALRDGESFELTLEFDNHGDLTIDVPVRL